MHRAAAVTLTAALAIPANMAAAAPRPVVLELFTSQSCASCPPADALLARLAATRGDVLVLDFHVDYWNYLSWKDRFSLPAATDRQRAYARLLGSDVYTPQLVIDGQNQAVGSDQAAVSAAVAAAKAALARGPTLTIKPARGQVTVAVGAASGRAQILLVGYDVAHVTQVGAGENTGRILREVNVVRSLQPVGNWRGGAMTLSVAQKAGDRVAVLLQAANGKMLAAASD